MDIIPAKESQLLLIEKMMVECICKMKEEGIYQWDEKYPNRDTFTTGIEKRHLYVLVEENEIIGIVIINERQNKGWEGVNWTYKEGKTLVVHSLAINPNYQRNGYGTKIIKFCEKYAKENGYNNIRLDTFSENQKANKLYQRQGYIRVGEIEYLFKPEGHQLYYCYEKKI